MKWVIGQISLGRTVEDAINRLQNLDSAPLKFCFRETYNLLSEPSKAILKSISLFSEPASDLEFKSATDLPIDKVNDGIAELVKVSMLNTYSSINDLPLYTALPMTRYFAQSLIDRSEQSVMLKRLAKYYEETESVSKLKEQAAGLLTTVGATTERGQAAVMFTQIAYGNYQRGRYGEAVKLFEQAIRIDPKLAFTYQTWASIEWQEGNFTLARELWGEATRLNPTNKLAWRSWGLMEKELGNLKKAEECLEEALKGNDRDVIAWNALGAILRKRGEYKKAERCLLKALYREPKTTHEQHHNAVTFHSLAITLKKLGRLDDSRYYCEQGLKMEPRNEKLISLQEELNQRERPEWVCK
jgi:tetratricopeptide (TPR) repeat protein